MEVGPPLGMVVVVGDDVVEVAAPGVASAPREHAGAVADDDVLADLLGGLVAAALQPLAQVDDRLHDDLDVGAPAPGRICSTVSSRWLACSIRPHNTSPGRASGVGGRGG